MSLQAVGEIVANVLEVIANGGGIGRKRAPPDEAHEPLVMAFGAFIVIFGCLGLCLCLDQWKQQSRVETQPAALASIVSLERGQSGSDRVTGMRLDFERPTPAGPVACRNVPVRLHSSPDGLETGKTIEVYPQPGSCYRPTYAPEIGSPQETLFFSLIAFLMGAFLFGGGYVSLRKRTGRRPRLRYRQRRVPERRNGFIHRNQSVVAARSCFAPRSFRENGTDEKFRPSGKDFLWNPMEPKARESFEPNWARVPSP